MRPILPTSILTFLRILVVIPVLCIETINLHGQANANLKEKTLGLSIEINAPLDSVWSRWTSEKQMRKFFAPASRVEFKPLGHLDILFAPDAPAGQRGAEDNFFLAIDEKKMLSFTWDCPPQFPEIRKQRTVVILRFHPLGNSKTLLTLSQTGWGSSGDWGKVYDYFGDAWGGFVLPNLKYSLEVRPIDWTDFPKHAPKDLKPADKL